MSVGGGQAPFHSFTFLGFPCSLACSLAGNSSPSQTRGSTCPPLRRKSSLEAQVTALAPRQPSIGDMRSPPRGLLRAHGVAVPQRQCLGRIQSDSEGLHLVAFLQLVKGHKPQKRQH